MTVVLSKKEVKELLEEGRKCRNDILSRQKTITAASDPISYVGILDDKVRALENKIKCLEKEIEELKKKTVEEK